MLYFLIRQYCCEQYFTVLKITIDDDNDDNEVDDETTEVKTIIRPITKLRDDGTIYNMKIRDRTL